MCTQDNPATGSEHKAQKEQLLGLFLSSEGARQGSGWGSHYCSEVYELVQGHLTKVAEVVEACMQSSLVSRLPAQAVGVAENP